MEYRIDYEALIQQLEDQAMLKLLLAVTPDAHVKDMIKKVIGVFIQHGVSVENALEIMKDIAEAFKTNEEENNNAED